MLVPYVCRDGRGGGEEGGGYDGSRPGVVEQHPPHRVHGGGERPRPRHCAASSGVVGRGAARRRRRRQHRRRWGGWCGRGVSDRVGAQPRRGVHVVVRTLLLHGGWERPGRLRRRRRHRAQTRRGFHRAERRRRSVVFAGRMRRGGGRCERGGHGAQEY